MDVFNHLFVAFLPYFCILSLATIALIFSERVGIINFGVNGLIVMGATFYMLFANIISQNGTKPLDMWMQIPLFIISALGGLILSLLFGFAIIKLKANQIITGVALNTLAPAITIALLFLVGEGNKLPYDINELALGNAANYEPTNFVSFKVIITLIIIALGGVVLSFTSWGLRYKAIGENPSAADVAGINVNAKKWQGMIIAGVLSGIAGAIYISNLSSGNTFKGSVEGLGYLGIAIMIVGRWKILLSIVITFAFSILFSLGQQYNNVIKSSNPSLISIIKMIPYLFTLFILIITSKPAIKMLMKKKDINCKWNKVLTKMSNYSNGPKAVGEPYDKAKR